MCLPVILSEFNGPLIGFFCFAGIVNLMLIGPPFFVGRLEASPIDAQCIFVFFYGCLVIAPINLNTCFGDVSEMAILVYFQRFLAAIPRRIQWFAFFRMGVIL